jgi:DNA-binding transcriptional LysR family regulator
MLELRRLRLLHALDTHGTVAATAKAFHMSGPAVSQQLALLEREAGTPLVERVGRTLRLTDAGQVLVTHTRIVLDQLAAAEADLVALGSAMSGTVRVAAFSSATATLIRDVWGSLRHQYGSAVGLQIATMEPAESLPALQRGDIDIAVTYSYELTPHHVPPWAERHHLLSDPIMLALHRDDPLQSSMDPGTPVDLAGLADREWVVPQPASTCRRMIERACGNAGFVPRTVAFGAEFPALLALVAAGHAVVALVPRLGAYQPPAELVLRPIRPATYRDILAVTRPGGDRHPAARVVLDHLKAGARNLGDQGQVRPLKSPR